MTFDAWFVWAKKEREKLGKALQNYDEDLPFGAGVFPDGHLQYIGACLDIEQRNNEEDFDYAYRMFDSLKNVTGANGIDRAIETIRNSRMK
jgi:hypothetical protein